MALKKQIAELDGQDVIQRFRDAIAAQPLGLSEYQRADDIAYLSTSLRQLASVLYQSDTDDAAKALDARYQAAQQAYQAVVLVQLMATFRLGDTETAPPSRLARPATQALPAKAPVAGNAQDWTHF